MVQWAYLSCISLLQRQGSRVRIPSPTFSFEDSFEECIVSGWPQEEDEEQEQEQEDHGRVKQEERGRRRGHSDQERLRERISVRTSNSIKWLTPIRNEMERKSV